MRSKELQLNPVRGLYKTVGLLLLFAVLFPVRTSALQQKSPQAAATSQSAATSPPAQEAGAPVVVDGKTILYVREGFFSFTAQERANLVSQKVQALINDSPARTKAITTVDAEVTTSIVSGDTVIMTVTDRDAAAAGS